MGKKKRFAALLGGPFLHVATTSEGFSRLVSKASTRHTTLVPSPLLDHAPATPSHPFKQPHSKDTSRAQGEEARVQGEDCRGHREDLGARSRSRRTPAFKSKSSYVTCILTGRLKPSLTTAFAQVGPFVGVVAATKSKCGWHYFCVERCRTPVLPS